MVFPEDPEIRELLEKLVVVLKKAGCYDERRRWIDIDPIWYNVDVLEIFVANMTKIIERLRDALGFNKFVLPDKVAAPYGILPIFVLVSQRLSPAIPFIIWKEMARPSTGESQIFGKLLDSDKLLLVNDVTNYGIALIRMKNDLETYREQNHLRYVMKGILVVIDRELGGLDFVEKSTGIKPMPILRISALNGSRA